MYILDGEAEATIDDSQFRVKQGDFLGYRSGGDPHKLENVGTSVLRCIVVGQRLDHDVGDYPIKRKRIYRNKGMKWNLVDIEDIDEPVAGAKA